MCKGEKTPVDIQKEKNGPAIKDSKVLPKISGVMIDIEKGVITLKLAGDTVLPEKGDGV